MTKERIIKELSKVRRQLADLQERQKDLESQLQMAEDAEKMKFIEKNKISLDRLILLNKVSEEEILSLLRKKSRRNSRHSKPKRRQKAMNKNMKLRYRAALSLFLSMILLTMPAVAFSMNGNNAIEARAEEETESGTGENPTEQETENSTEENTKVPETQDSTGETPAEQETEEQTESDTEGETEGSTESRTVSGNDIEPVCICEDKCGAYEYDHNCKVCVEDYKLCAYKKPNVSISINKPDGWFNDTVSVTFKVADVAHTGNFEIAQIQAKVGQNGSWTDVTEDRKLDISENCTVYVQVTDQKGNTYEKNRAVRCFDTTKPTLNAAVSDGLLSIQVHDTDSGAKAVYVNGYEFTELTNGTLNIRLQQFDAGYEYFTISAMDNAGNMSEVYKTKIRITKTLRTRAMKTRQSSSRSMPKPPSRGMPLER